jgi:hypothetical protein
MSLIKQKSQVFENTNQLYAKYDQETKAFILDCNEGLIWYISEDNIKQLTECFNVKIINIYKNINKPIKLIYCNSNYFANKVQMSDKNNNMLFGDGEFKFPLFFNGIISLNNSNNKYIEQYFQLEFINDINYCITNIKTAY